MGKPAARVMDNVVHPLPGILTPGPGSFNVIIGKRPAWRGLPAAAAAAIKAAKQVADTAVKTAETATKAAAGTPGAPAAYAAEQATKTAALTAMTSAIQSAAGIAGAASGGMVDIHSCLTPSPVPPHGPGVVIDGRTTVLINGLPACCQGDSVLEPLGPLDKIVMGEFTVLIGDAGSAGGGTAAGGGAAGAAAAAGVATAIAAAVAAVPAPGSPSPQNYATQREAAVAALDAANPGSIGANQEFGGLVYQNADGTYGYTTPSAGTGTGFNLGTISIPPGSTEAGNYHTHGDYSTAGPSGPVRTNNPAQDAYNSDNFSPTDRGTIGARGASNPNYRGYLGTPSGTYSEFDPNSNTVRNIP